MNIQQALDAFNNANQEIESLRARVAAYDKETKDIKAVRQRLSKTEQRMLQAFQAFQNGTVQSAHRTVRRYKKDSSINTVLAAIQEQSGWIHYKDLTVYLNATGKRTANGNRWSDENVSACLSTLKKEGQVHNDGRGPGCGSGQWRYGKGDRVYDQMPRGRGCSTEELAKLKEKYNIA